MKKLIYLLIAGALMVAGCKARKVAKSSSDSTTVKKETAVNKVTDQYVDISRSAQKKSAKITSVSKSTDNSETTITITPVPGTPVKVDPDGTFHGQASGVTTTKKGAKTIDETINSYLQETAGEIKGISDLSTTESSSASIDSTHFTRTTKTTEAKPGAWPWVVGIVVVLVVIIGLFWFKGKPKGNS